MKKTIFAALFLVLVSITAHATRWKSFRYEIYGGVGSSQMFGDIGTPAKGSFIKSFGDLRINQTRFSLFGAFRYKTFENQSVKAFFAYARAASNDLNQPERADGHPSRNYTAKTNLSELSLQYEYYFLPENRRSSSGAMFRRRGMRNNFSTFAAYAFTGVGLVFSQSNFINNNFQEYNDYYNVGAGLPDEFTEDIAAYGQDNVWIDESRRIEEVRQNAQIAASIPLGVGLKYTINTYVSLNVEIGRRFALSDYIDGFSTDISSSFDVYDFALVGLVYRIKTNRRGGGSLFGKKAGVRRKPGRTKMRRPKL